MTARELSSPSPSTPTVASGALVERCAARSRLAAPLALAEVALRRRRLRSLRPDHPTAGVLPRPSVSARSCATTRRPSRPRASTPRRSSSSVAARATRPAPCSMRSQPSAGSSVFVPVDVSEQTLRDARRDAVRALPRTAGRGARRGLHPPPRPPPARGRRLVAFLGGTIGNFYVEERQPSSGRSTTASSRVTRSCSARPRQEQRPAHLRLRRQPGSDRSLRHELPPRAQP